MLTLLVLCVSSLRSGDAKRTMRVIYKTWGLQQQRSRVCQWSVLWIMVPSGGKWASNCTMVQRFILAQRPCGACRTKHCLHCSICASRAMVLAKIAITQPMDIHSPWHCIRVVANNTALRNACRCKYWNVERERSEKHPIAERLPIDCRWICNGFLMDLQWIFNGFYIDLQWILYRFSIGFLIDFEWMVDWFSIVFQWISNRFTTDS